MVPGLRLRLAFQRVRDELLEQPKSGRAFVANRFELSLIEVAYGDWITNLRAELGSDIWTPGPVEFCNAPKGRGLVRPGVRMAIRDRVVYTAAVGMCLRNIDAQTRWSQKRIDFATQINSNKLSKREWLRSPFVGWKAWRDESLRLLALRRSTFVVLADIAGYFENISISLLTSDLLQAGCREDVIVLLRKCLNHWCQTPDRGLPQGILASDILAKVYLEAFDRHLKGHGLRHVRYADDLRIFCKSEREAREALVKVTELLRQRGLTLQSAKTQITKAAGLEPEFEGAVPAIQALQRDFIVDKKIRQQMVDDPSIPISAIDDLAGSDPTTFDPKVIQRAFRRFVVQSESPDKTMRRFLLRRFAALHDDTAVEYCETLVVDAPEATTEILRYFQDLDDPARFEFALVRALRDPDLTMYPYQQCLILDWLWRNAHSLRKPTRATIRKIALSGDTPSYVRIVCEALLGRFGDIADRERIATRFGSSSDPLERAQLLCCLSNLEKGRRNALMGRVKDEGPWVARAVKLMRLAPTGGN